MIEKLGAGAVEQAEFIWRLDVGDCSLSQNAAELFHLPATPCLTTSCDSTLVTLLTNYIRTIFKASLGY